MPACLVLMFNMTSKLRTYPAFWTMPYLCFHRKKVDSPFESRPRLARKNSLNSSSRISDSPASGETRLGNVQSDSVSHFDFKPLGGVTFRENPNSDVAIVGKGYAEDAQPAEPKPSLHAGKARERRRFNKSKLIQIGEKCTYNTPHYSWCMLI